MPLRIGLSNNTDLIIKVAAIIGTAAGIGAYGVVLAKYENGNAAALAGVSTAFTIFISTVFCACQLGIPRSLILSALALAIAVPAFIAYFSAGDTRKEPGILYNDLYRFYIFILFFVGERF